MSEYIKDAIYTATTFSALGINTDTELFWTYFAMYIAVGGPCLYGYEFYKQ